MTDSEKGYFTLKDRLSRLEDELEHLLKLQENRKTKSPEYSETNTNSSVTCPCFNNNVCLNTVVTKPKLHTYQRGTDLDPISNITKFLQQISVNLSRGTQAISKIASLSAQNKLNATENEKCKFCVKSVEHMPVVCKSASNLTKADEDNLFIELREEKDKRIKAENKVRSLKEEISLIKCSQENVQAKNVGLQSELGELHKQFEVSKTALENKTQELNNCNYLWSLKFGGIVKELEFEKAKRNEIESNFHNMYDSMKSIKVDLERNAAVEKTSNWLRHENEQLTSLTKQLKVEIERLNNELIKKDHHVEENVKKIKNLSYICEKMKNLLLSMRRKYKMSKDTLDHDTLAKQKLLDQFMEKQILVNKLISDQNEYKSEVKRLNELLSTATNNNEAFQSRIYEITEIMKQQNNLIAQQSETITIKDEQIKLENDNRILIRRKLQELEKMKGLEDGGMNTKFLNCKIDQLKLDLEKANEIITTKEQLIESHMKTISQMKHEINSKEEVIYDLKRDLSDVKRNLSIEKTKNEQLCLKIKDLQNQKDSIKLQLKEVEEDVETKLMAENTLRLEQIEKQVLSKQKEWEEQRKQLIKEKEDALEMSKVTITSLSEQLTRQKNVSDVQEESIKNLTSQLDEKQSEHQKTLIDVQHLRAELAQANESLQQAKLSFDAKLRSACDSWQKTFQLMQQ